jgi:hypothetical protein
MTNRLRCLILYVEFSSKNTLLALLLSLLLIGNTIWANEESSSPKKYYLSIAAIFKNEAADLKEWIEYHRLLGVEHFYLYNNGSKDNYSEVLQPYVENQLVTLVEWPDRNREAWGTRAFAWVFSTQLPAYEHACHKLAKDETTWLALIDIDEFLLPIEEMTIPALLEKYKEAPGINLRWRLYGTSGVKNLPKNTLLIEALNCSSHPDYFLNEQVKTILKPDLVDGFYSSPHRSHLKNGQQAVEVLANEARINHYINKTEDYFYNKKIKNKERMDNTKYSEEEIRESLAIGNDLLDSDKTIHRYVSELRKQLGYDTSEPLEKTIFLTIIARNKEPLLRDYLKCIENLNYNKKLITLYIKTNNNEDATEILLADWIKLNHSMYRSIIFDNREIQDAPLPHAPEFTHFKYNANLLNGSLQKAKESKCDFYFLVDVDTRIHPETLSDLVRKDKPIVAPMLRSTTSTSDLFSTYFCDVNETGYYKDHPDYLKILKRIKVGTFKVPLVRQVYLVKSDFLDKLSHSDESADYDFIIFSRHARKNDVDQFICNERNFGSFIRNN